MKAYPKDANDNFMDLRDYFAAKAMQKITWRKGEEDEDAKDCYVIADAMMKARKNENGTTEIL